MTTVAFIWLSVGLVAILGVAGIVRSDLRRRKGYRTRKGTLPGEGETVVCTASISEAGSEDHFMRVTRDPQDYARAFVPDRKN